MSVLVTVIITSYRRIPFLYRAIDSVLSQDYENIQLIVTDDASEDFHGEEVEKYIRKRAGVNLKELLILSHPENVGTVRNLNGALEHMKGEYCIELADDDILISNHTISDVMKACLESGADFIAFSSLVGGKDKRRSFYPHRMDRKKVQKLDTPRKLYMSLLSGMHYEWCGGSSFVYSRRGIVEMGYYDTAYRLMEDYPFYLKLTWKQKVVFRPDILLKKYSLQGVSHGKGDVPPLLKQDIETLRQKDLFAHYEELSKKEQRALDLYRCINMEKKPLRVLKPRMIPYIINKISYRTREKIAYMWDIIWSWMFDREKE